MSDELERLANRLRLSVTSGVVGIVDDSGSVQLAQIIIGPTTGVGAAAFPALGIRDATPVLGQFGHASNPPAGANVVLLSVGGDLSNAVVIATGHQALRLLNLAPGDSALYDARGAYAWFQAAGLTIDAAGLDVTIQNAADINITGTGKVTVTAPHVIVDSTDVELGAAGGQPVARVGDTVAGGVITSGSSKVKAA